MGQEQSQVSDDTPSETLSARSLEAVADYIKSGKARRIIVMTGAGISTAAGIPDFRSPETGLYNNLARLNLPYAEAVFDINFFRTNPDPFYVLAKELYPGRYQPTLSHVFIALLARKGLLLHLFTQNIDCLERTAGVPADLIVEAHGSFASQHCIDCHAPYPDGLMREHVERGEVPRCTADGCNGLVKPDIVFFGEALPRDFFARMPLARSADLALILGTSLTVYPFAGLPGEVPEGVPRVLFNLERVGTLGCRPDDVLVLKDCDTGVLELAEALGWRAELEAGWRALVGDAEAQRQLHGTERRDGVRGELEQLTEQVDKALRLDEDRGQGANEGNSAGRDSVREGKAAAAAAAVPDDSERVREDGEEDKGKPQVHGGGLQAKDAADASDAAVEENPPAADESRPSPGAQKPAVQSGLSTSGSVAGVGEEKRAELTEGAKALLVPKGASKSGAEAQSGSAAITEDKANGTSAL